MPTIEGYDITIDGRSLSGTITLLEFTDQIDTDGQRWIPAEVTPEGWEWLRERYGSDFFDETTPDEAHGALIEDLIPEAVAEWKATRDR